MENKKIVDYTVVFGSDPISLAARVKEKGKEGFVPQGSVSRSYSAPGELRYMQAMVKY